MQQGKVLSFSDNEAEAKGIASKEVREVTEQTLEKIRSTTLRLLERQNPDFTEHLHVTG